MKKIFLSLLGCVLATVLSWSQSSVPDQLAYDDFEVDGIETVALHNASSATGFGWEAAWKQQNSNTTIPGFNISEDSPLSYSGLVSTPKYAVGGYAWQGSGRVLDRRADGSFADYVNDASRIGKAGTVLWFSAIYRRDANSASSVIYFHNDTNMGNVGGGALGVTIQDGEFALKMDGANATPVKTGVAATVGEVFLIVVKMEFGDNTDDNKHKVSLFVNPAIGGAEPAAQATAESSNGNIPFAAVGWNPFQDAGGASIDEIRFGKTFASVTPPTPEYADVTAITVKAEGDVTELVRGTKIRMNAELTPDNGNPDITWSVEPGTGDAVITPAGVLMGRKNGTVTVKATALSGVSGSQEITITDAEFKPVITATATEVSALSPSFNIAFNSNDEIMGFSADMIQINGTAGEGTIVKLSGSFPNYTATVFGMPQTGDLSLTIPAGAVKLKYDDEYGNLESVSDVVNYSRTFPVSAEEDVNIIYFNGNDLESTVALDKNRYVVDAEGSPYVAILAFDETKPIFDGVTGGSAFKGGIRFDHSDGEKKADASMIDVDRLIPNLVQFNSNDERTASFWMQQSGNNEAVNSSYKDNLTFSFVWTKEQFMNGGAEATVAFDEHSTIRFNLNVGVDGGKLHYIVKNGNQYYISQTEQTGSGMLVLTGFNNTEDQKWLSYDPATLAIPSDFAEATAVDFNDVQAVGFIYNAVHQWHRNCSFNFFSVDGVKKSDLLAYEDFQSEIPADTTAAPLQGSASSTSFGWSGTWAVENDPTGLGFVVCNEQPLAYGDLASTTNYAKGGYRYQGSGRILDRSVGGPFASYLIGSSSDIRQNTIGKSGTTLWTSLLYRVDKSSANAVLYFHKYDIVGTSAVSQESTLGTAVVISDGKFALKHKDNDNATWVQTASDVSATVGETYLFVVKMEFAEGTTESKHVISLYINPADLKTIPETANITVETAGDITFKNIGWKPESGSEGASIDEIRFGRTYQSVLPIGPKATFDLSDKNGVALDSKITATMNTAVYMPDLSEIKEEALADMFELKRGDEAVAATISIGVPRSEFIITPDNALSYDSEYTITLKGGVVSSGLGILNAPSSAKFRTVADVTALNAKIETCKSVHDEAVEGSEDGQYDPGSKELFNTAIVAAEAVVADVANKTQSDVNNALAALTEAERLFNLAKVGASGEIVIFKEGFKNNVWHQANADKTGELDMSSDHYFADPIYICGNWGGEKGWPNSSGGSNLNFGGGGADRTILRIQKLNTTVISEPKLSLAQIWDPITVSYSTDQGASYTEMTDRTSVWGVTDNWQFYTYNDVLPSVEDLWIKIEKVTKESGTTLLDDITVSGMAITPVVAFNIETGSKGVDPATAITATSSAALVNALDLSEITDPSSLFVLKKNDANGEDVAFAATIDDAKKVFTLTPANGLSFDAAYYVALKNRVVADASGTRAVLTESTFKTIADTSALSAKVNACQELYDNAVEGSGEGEYDAGSKELLNSAIVAANAVLDNAVDKSQQDIDDALAALSAAENLFNLSKVGEAGEIVLFKEGFGNNVWHQSIANVSGEMEMDHMHYFAEPIYICGNWAGSKDWPNTSDGSNLNLTPTADCPDDNPECGNYKFTGITIQKLNTTQVGNVRLSFAMVWNSVLVSYSTDQGQSWVSMTDRTQIGGGSGEQDWKYYRYDDVLPACEDLWIRIEKETMEGSTLIDDITISGSADTPSVAFNIESGSIGVDVATTITATSSVALVNVPDLSEITDPTSYFVLKEDAASGADVAFTATIDADKKVFTLTPGAPLKYGSVYYLALKDRVVADAAGARVPLTECNFITIADFSALTAKINEAQTLYDGAVEGERNGDYIAGSKAIFNDAIVAAVAVKDNTESAQSEVDAAVTALDNAMTVFNNSKVVVDFSALSDAVTAAESLIASAVEGDRNGDYVSGSKATYQQAIDAAKAVRDNTTATQTEVNDAKEALDAATTAFENAKVVVDYDALDAAIDAAEAIVGEADYTSKYTDDSRSEFESALEAAKTVSANVTATQAEVDAAKDALTEAQNNLRYVGIDGTEMSVISVYPNPAADYIRIRGVENATVTIVSMNGALVLSEDAYTGGNLDVSALSSGTYIVKVDNKVTTFIKK